ncbi:MAG: hypothetical protein EON60_07625 [Alphaproteobacteria bacterium]|nr:MAG: hypothetical protein EON60_07625 [Alphaproteobacteria bacterium]
MTDIVLPSSFSSDHLTFNSIERFNDGSGYKIELELESNPFTAKYLLFIEQHVFDTFTASLTVLEESLTGEAILKPDYESQFVKITAGHSGHMFVSGELITHDERGQFLSFNFRTDQTCVRQFLNGMRRELQAVAF